MRKEEILEPKVKINIIDSIKSTPIFFQNPKSAFAYKSTSNLRKAYYLFKAINNNLLVKIGPRLTNFALKIGLPIKPILKSTLFAQFCGGETIEECMGVIETLGNFHVKSILDYSVEGEKNEEVFEHTTQEIIKTLKKGSQNKNIPFAVFKVSGLGRHQTISGCQNESLVEANQKAEVVRIKERVNEICKAAYQLNLPVMIDAEESWLQDFIDSISFTMMEKYNREQVIVINTYQMYRTDRLAVLRKNIQEAKDKDYLLGVKLVRGAYMEKERIRAAKMGYPSPIQSSKEETDQAYNEALFLCLKNINQICLVAGTHNEISCSLLAEKMIEFGFPAGDSHIYFSQLLGMSDHISFNLSKMGFNVAKYVPYGPLKAVLPYLFRRAEENTSISGQMSRELALVTKELERRKLEKT